MIYLYISLGVIAAAVFSLLAVVLIRAALFTPKAGPAVDDGEVTLDKDAVITRLAELVKCKTVSYRDPSLEDDAEFRKLLDLLPTLYPKVFATCEYRELADRGLLFKWTGKTEGAPAVLMAHYDVVPVDEASWEKPPFEGIYEDGVLWGRGTLDTKVTFASALYALDKMIGEGFTPECDIYLAFSGCEEVNGKGAVHIVDYFEEQGITPAIVLDEGGAVVEGAFPGVVAPCAMVGIAEKGHFDLEYKVKSSGGHASAPKPHSPLPTLAEACIKLEKNPFKTHITPPVGKMFDTLGRHANPIFRVIFANLWCFRWVLDLISNKSGGGMNALMRTTVAFTQAEGSSAANVIPPEATIVSNIRLNPVDTIDSAVEYIRKTVDDGSVELTVLRGTNPSRISTTDCEGYEKLSMAIVSTWRGSIVSPYLMMQGSDSRHWGRISDKVFRFSAMDLTEEERASIHGHNERIRIDCLKRSAEFYIRLIKTL